MDNINIKNIKNIEVISYLVGDNGYDTPPQDGKGNKIYDGIICKIIFNKTNTD